MMYDAFDTGLRREEPRPATPNNSSHPLLGGDYPTTTSRLHTVLTVRLDVPLDGLCPVRRALYDISFRDGARAGKGSRGWTGLDGVVRTHIKGRTAP